MLFELAKQDLRLPLVTPDKRPEQLTHFKAIFRRAAGRDDRQFREQQHVQ
jgi:hypothetical protein